MHHKDSERGVAWRELHERLIAYWCGSKAEASPTPCYTKGSHNQGKVPHRAPRLSREMNNNDTKNFRTCISSVQMSSHDLFIHFNINFRLMVSTSAERCSSPLRDNDLCARHSPVSSLPVRAQDEQPKPKESGSCKHSQQQGAYENTNSYIPFCLKKTRLLLPTCSFRPVYMR